MRRRSGRVVAVVAVAAFAVGLLPGVATAASAESWTKTYCKGSDNLKKVVQAEGDKMQAAFSGVTSTSDLNAPAAVLTTAITNTEKALKSAESALKKAGTPSGVKDGKKVQKALLAATADARKHIADAKVHLAAFNPADRSTALELSGAASDFASALSAWDDARLGALQSSAQKDQKFAKLLVKYCKAGV
jgi:hypothetical protein